MLNRLFNTLFGKLFAGFYLVILLTAAGVWMTAYSAQSQQNEDIGRIEWRFIAHKSVDSAVRQAFNARNNASNQRPTTVKCWLFKAN